MCNKTRYKLYFTTTHDSTTLFHPRRTRKGAQCSKYRKKNKSSQQLTEKKNYELVHFWNCELGAKFWIMTELVNFKICELNFELVHVESELSQHCMQQRCGTNVCSVSEYTHTVPESPKTSQPC